MAHSARDEGNEYRVPIGIVILLQAIFAFVYIIPVESLPSLSADLRLRYLEPVLFFIPAATALLYRWRGAAGRWFAVLTPATIVFALQIWFPIPGSLALLAPVVALAAGLLAPHAAVAVAGAGISGALVLRALTGAPDGWQIGIAFIAVLTTLVLSLTVHRAVMNAAAWSHDYYQKALRIMQENRTDRSALEQALDDLAHANRQMTLLYERQTSLQRVAEEAERTKSAFVAKVSHEFRTPLNMIIGLSSVMLENPRLYGRSLPPALLEDLQIIHRNCDHLAGLVDDVLALSQLQSGSIVLHREHLDLTKTIKEALDVVRPLLSQKKLSLTVEIPDQLISVAADRTRIRQVILNLLSNAARFTDQGGISICVSEQEKQVVIAVADSGPGIAAADMERIFEPFCQGSEQLWREKGGSGLGLTISKQFVELHGGRIWLESQIGIGTTFFVALPPAAPLPPARLPGSWISRDWQWVERQRRQPLPRLPDWPRVVIYDLTQEIEAELGKNVVQVEMVSSASLDDVVAEVRNTPAHVVLFGAREIDELLPLLQSAAEQLPDTPLIGWMLPAQTAPALAAGADQYLTKPISLPQLKQRLGALATSPQHVLIADDDEEARLLLTRMLLLYDPALTVETVAGGDEALQRLQDKPCDLLLLDMKMQGVDGLQVLERVRSQPHTQAMPVIVISGQDLYETRPVCREMTLLLGKGIALEKALECAVGISQTLFTPVAERHPAPG